MNIRMMQKERRKIKSTTYKWTDIHGVDSDYAHVHNLIK